MVLFILISFVILNKILYKSYLNPIFLQSVLWSLYYFFLNLNIDLYDIRMSDIDKFVLIQSIGFSLGGFLCILFTRRSAIYQRQPFNHNVSEITYKNLLLFYPYIVIIISLSVIMLLKEANSLSIFSVGDLKEELIEDDGKKFGTFGLIQLLSSVYVVIFIATQNAIKENKYKFIILLCTFIYFTLLLGSKGQFVFFFCSTIYLLIWKNKISKSQILIAVVFLIGFMLLVTLLRFGGDKDSITSESILNILIIYTITSLPGLQLFNAATPKVFGYYTFRILYVWLNKLGFDFPVAPVLSEFTMTPLPTNVYSYIKPYYHDFGYTGVFLLPLMLGAIHNFFYFKANKGNLNYLILSAFLVYPLGMQIFEENYFRQFTNWIYVFIFIQFLTQVNFNANRRSHNHLQPAVE